MILVAGETVAQQRTCCASADDDVVELGITHGQIKRPVQLGAEARASGSHGQKGWFIRCDELAGVDRESARILLFWKLSAQCWF